KKDLGGELARELLSVTREYNVPVQRVPVERINKVTRKNHQGVIAFMAAVDYYHVDDIVPALYDEGINQLVVVLDGVTDVRNFGAIARTCECAGVNCIVIPERNSVSVNADAVKTSAGALNYLPVCRERNLVKAVQYLRDSGFKVMGASEKTDLNYTKADFTGPVAIVLGAEDTGISTDVLKLCDTLVAIPEFGQINSLNVSVAGGIMIYEVVRQRLNDGQNVNS
ncbi:MAG: 23S rRNA (guanosine(2251)-2'-O)-methyltransferase RlmB, partial [Bacteroidales bacterium]|nr:23S rRNA (guanosine(2251)-2'-O)-methyltransferase RlmB [Bacteroidales bacterium]MDY4235183.1 23S rRNA (guanosine(2251)-2'-O)-methyltransferase RlmB [Sodaliphilus sp.]